MLSETERTGELLNCRSEVGASVAITVFSQPEKQEAIIINDKMAAESLNKGEVFR